MQSDVSVDSAPPGVLLAETRRVLDAQQRLVQRQRTQATNVVRIILTTCGLGLTLGSIAVSADLAVPTGNMSRWPLQLLGADPAFALVPFGMLVLLTCRMLCAALVVLEPQTTQRSLVRLLTTPIRARSRPLPSTPMDVSFRAGLDADATTDLSENPDPIRDVLRYNAGCVAGNTLLIEQNRWYLTRVYRSAAVSIAIVTLSLLLVLAAHVVSRPG